jgi:hypothetical protein
MLTEAGTKTFRGAAQLGVSCRSREDGYAIIAVVQSPYSGKLPVCLAVEATLKDARAMAGLLLPKFKRVSIELWKDRPVRREHWVEDRTHAD